MIIILEEMKEIYRDELTGCYNRRYMHNWLESEIKRANRFDTKFALLLIDIDDFRNVNNIYGHLEGDRVLVRFSEFLHENVREVDSIVRFGGDEYIVLMPNSHSKGAMELGQRIIDALGNTAIRSHKLHCSIGYAVFPDDATRADALLHHADGLMYQAKQQGKNRIGVKHEAIRKLRIPSPVTIGRDDETNWCLAQLKDHNTIFIAGAVGIGKTRLVLEIKDRLNTQVLARGNSYETLCSVAFHPFKNMFNELFSKEYVLVQQTMKRLVDVYQSELAKLLPIEGLLQAPHTEELDKYRLYHAVSEFIAKLSETTYPASTVLFMDDLHWADRPSCELLDFLMRSVRQNVRIFGTYRVEELSTSPLSEYLGIWARERLYAQIALSPLSEEQSTQLLDAIIGTVPALAAKTIYQESGGNPFFIEEILNEFHRARKLYWDGHEWVFVKGMVVSLPKTIEETVKRKLRIIDPEIRSYLEIAAVFGQEFNPELIANASKRNVGQVMEALDELCKLGFVKSRTMDNYFFSEDIVRHIVYQNITRARQIECHKSVGEAIETAYHSVIENFHEQLAEHFAQARDRTKALIYAKKAAQKAHANYAHGLAIKYYEDALKYEDSVEQIFEINLALADIYTSTGEYRKALDQLHICQQINAHAYLIYEKCGNVYEKMGDYRNSSKYYEKGMKIAKGSGAVYIFRAALAWLYTRMGQYMRAKKECEDMLRKKRQIGNHTLGDVYVILGVVLLRLGKFNRAEQYFRKSLSIRKSIGDKKNIAACYVDLGLNYQGKFNVRMSEKLFNKALSLYQEIGYQEGILITLNNLGVMYASYDLPKAEAYCLEALSKAKLIGAKRSIVLLHNNLGMISYNRLMPEQALISFRQALRLAKEINFYEGIIFASISMSELYRERGNLLKGKTHLKTALQVADEINVKFLNVDCLMEEMEYHLKSRQYKGAQKLARKMTVQLDAESNVLYRIYNLLYRGRILVMSGAFARAQILYGKAFNYVKTLPENKISGEICFYKGMACKNEGKQKEALKMFLQAESIFKKIGNLRYLDKIEQEIAGVKI